MTLEEAIKINETLEKNLIAKGMLGFAGSVRLGIEALKRERECRENMPREEWLLLPGETEK